MSILRPYQCDGARWLASRRHALLADEMRLGKTPQSITAACGLGAQTALTVCPAIAVPQWKLEWQTWGYGVRPEVWSYDKLRATDISDLSWDVVIVDECHFAVNPDAKRTAKVYSREGAIWRAGALWALSGTPAKVHAAELWAMLRAFGITKLSYEEFVATYCTVNPLTDRITGTRMDKVHEVRDMLKQIMLRRTRRQVAPELPDIDYNLLHIDSKGADLPFETDEPSDYDPNVRQDVALSKVPALAEEIADCIARGDYKQTVVFGWHREPLTRLAYLLGVHGIEAHTLLGGQAEQVRTGTQRAFQDGQIAVVAAQILAAGTAIDLSAANHGYFLELDWVPGNNVQAANRLINLMKDTPVSIDVCTRAGTTDARMQKVLLRRTRELGTML